LPENLDEELATANSLGVQPMSVDDPGFDDLINQGTIKYVVTESGDLVVGPYSVDGTEISHAVLSGGDPVLAAGEAEIAGSSGDGYFGISLNVQSGHFLNGATQAQSAAATQVAKGAFAGYGIYY
jgi:hypothetical protein